MKVEWAYGGRKSCGCLVAAVMDDSSHASDVRRAVSEFLRNGLTIHRMNVEEIRSALAVCKCESRQETLAV